MGANWDKERLPNGGDKARRERIVGEAKQETTLAHTWTQDHNVPAPPLKAEKEEMYEPLSPIRRSLIR